MAQRTTLTEAEVAFVERMRSARLATADEHGTPHLIPICYAFDGTRFYTLLDKKAKRVSELHLRRVRNIEARPEASLLIDQYTDDWAQLGYILIHGRAELLAPGNALHTSALALLRARYGQYRAMAVERSTMIMLTPDRVTSWGPALNPLP